MSKNREGQSIWSHCSTPASLLPRQGCRVRKESRRRGGEAGSGRRRGGERRGVWSLTPDQGLRGGDPRAELQEKQRCPLLVLPRQPWFWSLLKDRVRVTPLPHGSPLWCSWAGMSPSLLSLLHFCSPSVPSFFSHCRIMLPTCLHVSSSQSCHPSIHPTLSTPSLAIHSVACFPILPAIHGHVFSFFF